MNIMGWGNHARAALRPKTVDHTPPVTSDTVKADLIAASVLPVEDSFSDDYAYPIWPRTTRVEDLPYIEPIEVSKKDGKQSSRLWLVIDDIVYDCSQFVHQHPGGPMPIRTFAGKSCSWQFHKIHSSRFLKTYAEAFRVGRTSGVGNPYKEPERTIPAFSHVQFE